MKKNIKNEAKRERERNENENVYESRCSFCLTSFWVNLRSGIFHEWTKQSVNPRLKSRQESHENDFGSWCEWLYEKDFRRKTRRKRTIRERERERKKSHQREKRTFGDEEKESRKKTGGLIFNPGCNDLLSRLSSSISCPTLIG